ncbi:MAG: hypothetical protein ACK5NT_13735 [Pyrinomonadaceae bacterium]
MSIAYEIVYKLGDQWLPVLYREKIRTQRTRAYSLDIPERQNNVELQYTLLGIELKIRRQRFSCPDLSTARYIRVFARLGISQFAIPYDISLIPANADMLESSWQLTLLTMNEIGNGLSPQRNSQLRSAIVKQIRLEINEIGAGDAMPGFEIKRIEH